MRLDSVRERLGVRQGLGSRGTGSRTNQVVKRGRVLDARSVVLQIPQVAQGLQNRGGAVRGRLSGDGVDTVVLDVALGSVGRDQPGGHTATQTVEVERVRAAVLGGLGVGLVVRADGKRRSNVVKETTCLIEGDEQESLVPLGAGAQGVVDLLHKNLAERDVTGRVHGVGVQTAAGGVDVRQLGQQSQVSVLEEVLQGHNVALRVLGGPVVEQGVRQEVTVGAVVVAPRDILLAGGLEDAGNGNGRHIEGIVVGAVTVGSTGEGAKAVGVGGLDNTIR